MKPGPRKGTHSSPETEFKKGHTIWKGRHHSDETRQKLSRIRKGKKTALGHKGAKYWQGKPRSEETKRKIRETLKGRHTSAQTEFKEGLHLRQLFEGRRLLPSERTPNGGRIKTDAEKARWQQAMRRHFDIKGRRLISDRHQGIAYDKWRRLVIRRDHHECQSCHQTSGTMYAHHLKPFRNHPSLRYDLNNGITLCGDCHYKIHHNGIPISR